MANTLPPDVKPDALDKLPPGVISKPDALDKYRKPERTFQRRLSKALRTRNEAFLSHLYLSTTDGVVRKGMDVAEGDVEQLKGKGLYPVWHVEEEWFKNEYDQKSQKKAKDKAEGDPTASQPASVEPSFGDRAGLVAEVESLRRELDSEKSHKDLLRNQLEIKDNQIKAANEREQQTNVLMKDLHALMGDLQQRLAAQRSNHADHVIQGWRIRRRILLANSHVDGFPFTGFEDDFAVEIWALTAKVA